MGSRILSIEWLCCRWPWVTPKHVKPPQFLLTLCVFIIGDLIAKTTNLMYRLNVQVTAYGQQTVPDRGVVRSCNPLQNFGASNHITGTAEPKVVKFCTRVGNINSMQQDDMTVFKFRRSLWCSASRRFVSDSWATCNIWCCLSFLRCR